MVSTQEFALRDGPGGMLFVLHTSGEDPTIMQGFVYVFFFTNGLGSQTLSKISESEVLETYDFTTIC